LIFPIVCIPTALFTSEMKINGVLRAPELFQRMLMGVLAGGGPLVWCYLDSIRPIKRTEAWLREELQLTEINAMDN
jgi:hypothetical protein